MKATRIVIYQMAATIMAFAWPAYAQMVTPSVANGKGRIHAIRGGGGWKTDGKPAVPNHRWSLQLTRGDDDSLTGSVTIGGSPLASSGKVHGEVMGDAVFGTITDNAGNEIAAFEGTIGPKGMSGKYLDRTGETGDWAWDGAPQ